MVRGGRDTWPEPVGEQVEAKAASTSRAAVSRRFVAATERALAELMAADLSGRDLVALMVDGVGFAEHLCVVALGIGIDGTKHPLALVEGSTENATLVRGLLVGLRERGLNTTGPILAVLDGAKALSKAVREVFDKPLIQRCQEHVRDRLPEKLRSLVQARMRQAYHADSALAAEAKLTALAKELDKTHPGALTITGPPPKFHGSRDMLPVRQGGPPGGVRRRHRRADQRRPPGRHRLRDARRERKGGQVPLGSPKKMRRGTCPRADLTGAYDP